MGKNQKNASEKNGQFTKRGSSGGNEKKTSEHQSSWFHRARVNDLCMVQIDPEVSLGVPWHIPRDCSDYHVKKFWSDTLGVRLRYLVFPVKSNLTGKTRYLSRAPKVSDQNFLTWKSLQSRGTCQGTPKLTSGSIWTLQRSLTRARQNQEFWCSEIIFSFSH